MAIVRRGALAAGLALLSAQVAAAACMSRECPNPTLVEGVRSLVAAVCDCAGAPAHGEYVRCAKGVIKDAVRHGTFPRQCKNTAGRCEAQSTCGFRHAAVCCTLKGDTVRVRMMKQGGRCPGTACAGAGALADACTTDGACAPARRRIQPFHAVQEVFHSSCALPSCHSVIARKGGLVLESEDVSYTSLVGRPAAFPEASGMMRVQPGDPGASLLVRKLRALGPGTPMPQTGGTLSEGIIRMIEQWIARGAHTTAAECSAGGAGQPSVACDEEPPPPGDYVWKALPPLDPPATGEGIQLHTPPRPVVPGEEWETCYAFHPDWPTIAAEMGVTGLPVIRQQVYRMHPGSHHLLLYAYFGQYPEQWATGYFPCVAANCVNDADCPPDSSQALLPIGGTQVASTRYEVDYPAGVGIPVLSPTSVLIANLHFTNPFQPSQPIHGEAWLNLNFYKPNEFKAILDGVFAINFRDLIVEPYTTRTITSMWQPRSLLTRSPADAAVFQLFGHMHKRGTLFQVDYVKGGTCSVTGKVCGRDDDCECKPWQSECVAGQTCTRGPAAEDSTIYYTTAWDEAPILDFTAPYLLVNHDEGLRWTCTHTNGVAGDPGRPPKRCAEGCEACGWDAASRTCIFTRGVSLGVDPAPRVYAEGDPMPLVFGQLADDDMCNMFGYFIHQDQLSKLP